jgi:hypothetical protein
MTTQTTSYAVTDAERPLWVGQTPAAWGDVVRSVDPEEAHDAASIIRRGRTGLVGEAASA